MPQSQETPTIAPKLGVTTKSLRRSLADLKQELVKQRGRRWDF